MFNSTAESVGEIDNIVDRRKHERPTMVLRVGLLEHKGRSAYCLLRNISQNGVQVKLYSSVSKGSDVRLQVGDENFLRGSVAWVRDDLAGITFENPLEEVTLLRVRQLLAPHRRRGSPRAIAAGFAILRTGGQAYSAKLRDISTSGARVLTDRSIESGRSAVLLLPDLPALRAFVRWTHGQDTGLSFETPIPIQVITEWLGEQAILTTRAR